MRQRLRRDSPVPIYHQIAEALRNAIAVGELAPGARLPSVRAAAADWGVNLHTVRKAYSELEQDGLVRMSGARGTEVTGGGGAGSAADSVDLDTYLAATVRTARERFGLTQLQLGQLLVRGAAAGVRPTVHVIECSRTQADGHCEELMRAWRVAAKPLVLSETAELPGGVLIGTYFHYNDIRQRWPDRLDDIRFVAIAPDAALAARLAAARVAAGAVRGRTRLLVCELDEAKAVNIAADLKNLFPSEGWEIAPRVLSSPASLPRRRAGEQVLVAPRVWGALSEKQRERAVHIRYCVRAQELESLGASYGWERTERRETA
jgi:GntR family transcriptional regulator